MRHPNAMCTRECPPLTIGNSSGARVRSPGLPVGSATAFRDFSHGPSAPLSSMIYGTGGPCAAMGVKTHYSERHAYMSDEEKINFAMYVLEGVRGAHIYYYYLKPKRYCTVKCRNFTLNETSGQQNDSLAAGKRYIINAALTQYQN